MSQKSRKEKRKNLILVILVALTLVSSQIACYVDPEDGLGRKAQNALEGSPIDSTE